MKVGSLVECVCNDVKNPDWKGIRPIVGQIYTVREVNIAGEPDLIYVEEIVNGPDSKGYEWALTVRWFREIQPPMDLSFIQELQNEMV